MKRLLFLAVLAISVFAGQLFGQIIQPAKWSVELSEKNAKVGDKIDVVFKATIEPTWHLYSNDFDPDLGPLLIEFEFEENSSYNRIGDVKPMDAHKKYDDLWEGDVSYFEDKGEMRQTIEVLELPLKIKGVFEFQSCSEITGQCVLGDDGFDLSITGGAVVADVPKEETAKELPKSNLFIDSRPSDDTEKEEVAKIEETKAAVETIQTEESQPETETRSYWGIFFLAFGAGFLALLTPCVFPMIPMTVSFFTKQSTNKAKGIKNAALYGVFIILIYVILGSIVVAVFGVDALNALSTNPWFNLVFFILLVVFAVSFMGAFEIVLPSKWVNKADAGVDKGGIAGSFFMALTLALVSFSCTGPVVGGILFESATHGGIAPIIGMLGFGTALALPFTFFAAFPGYLNSLPKSGGWLNSVKVVLGFLELALAFKFLSNADLVLNLHMLEREVFIAIWIAVFGALGFYLLGKLRLPHDSPMEYLPVSRLLLGLFVLSFTIYMIPGLWGAPLKMISAFPPPMEYSESPEGVGNRSKQFAASGVSETAKNMAKLEDKMDVGAQGLHVFHEYDDALAYAKKVGKPLFLDFTGKACVNCRQMEINVWSDPEVNYMLKNDFVIAALYVDYRKKLPEEEQYVSETTGKKIKTVGNKWSDFQISKYKINSQPYYVLLDHNENELTTPKAFDLDTKAYAAWLKVGLGKFNQSK